jgi:hypothetical protein
VQPMKRVCVFSGVGATLLARENASAREAAEVAASHLPDLQAALHPAWDHAGQPASRGHLGRELARPFGLPQLQQLNTQRARQPGSP